MKKLNLLLTLLIVLLVFSCSSDDSQPNREEQNNEKLYKKTEGFNNGILTVSQEVFYNSNSNIESVTLNDIGYLNRTFNVSYSGTNIIGITRATDIVNPNGTDEIVNYSNVTIGDNSIVLISNESDRTLEIIYSNGYVDSTKFYPTSTPNNVFEQTFNRNSTNQLISNNTGGDIFEYSNFDIDKKLDPFGSVMEYEHSTFFLIFGLKVTKDNPLTATYNFSGGGTYSNYLEYDEQGYVVKVSYDEPNSTTNYTVNEYIEQ